MKQDEIKAAVEGVIARRIATCETAGNETQAKKWRAELKALTLDGYVAGLAKVDFDPASLDGMAVYAAMKLRRLVGHMIGAGRADPYTDTLVKNAAAVSPGAAFKNTLMNASLNAGRATGHALPMRRHGTEGTAATQACSSRAALVALGAGQRIGKSGFQINQSHPAIAAILGVPAQEISA